jgi:hypothetical protein
VRSIGKQRLWHHRLVRPTLLRGFSNLFSEQGPDVNGSNLGRDIIIRAIRIAPAFQNFCMGIYRDSCRKVVEPEREMAIEPCVEAIEQLCGYMPRGSLLRSLTVDTLSYENPLQMNKRGGTAWEKWRSLLTADFE